MLCLGIFCFVSPLLVYLGFHFRELLFLFLCVYMFLLLFLSFLEGRGRKKEHMLGGQGIGEDLGEIGGEKNMIKMFFFNKVY